MSDKYILNSKGEPVPEGNLAAWASWYETAKRHVADERFDGQRVSTVFLAMDHAFGGPAPILWETMVFGGPMDQHQERCGGLRDEAEAMHKRIVEQVRAAQKDLATL